MKTKAFIALVTIVVLYFAIFFPYMHKWYDFFVRYFTPEDDAKKSNK